MQDEPDWGRAMREPTPDAGKLELGQWAKSAAPHQTAAAWKWSVLPDHALPVHALSEYALGDGGMSCFPDDDPLWLLPADRAESLRSIYNSSPFTFYDYLYHG